MNAPSSCSAMVWALYKKEARAFFATPAAYIVSVVFLLITGYLFASPLFIIGQASLESFTGLAPLLLTFFVPAVTMRLFSEEHKSGTLELLLTLPARDRELVLSKFLAALSVVWSTLTLTLAYPAAVGALGGLDGGAVLGTYLALGFSTALMAAIGLFASAMTRNQIVAFIIAFLACFFLYAVGKLETLAPEGLAPLAHFIGLDSHFDSMARGVLDTRDLLYYASGTGLFLHLAQVRLWRARLG